MLSFIFLCFACGCLGGATLAQYIRNPAPAPYPWYGSLVTLGLFLWSLSEVISRWPGGGKL
jgi:hypothetical protein